MEGCHIELHDLQFSVGEKIEDCYDDLRSKRIGDADKVHLDAFVELKYIDGYEVILSDRASADTQKLYMVNAGGYMPDFFGEKHEIGFFVKNSRNEATKAALDKLLLAHVKQHQDNLYDVDDCITLEQVSGYHIQLVPTEKAQNFRPLWTGYGKFDREVTSQIKERNY